MQPRLSEPRHKINKIRDTVGDFHTANVSVGGQGGSPRALLGRAVAGETPCGLGASWGSGQHRRLVSGAAQTVRPVRPWPDQYLWRK